MRLLGKLAIGGGAVSVVTAGALVIGGVFATSATLVAVDHGAAPARADSLAAFDDCGALLDWYVANNLSEVGPYGWGDQRIYFAKKALAGATMRRAPQAVVDSAAGTLDARGSSSTGTNTQEVDVDEPDVAKTDGKLLVRLTRPRKNFTDQMLAVSDVTGAEKYTLGRLHLPETSEDSQLLLVGTHVVVTQSVNEYGPIAYDERAPIGGPEPASTRVLDIDVADPRHPRLVGTDVYSGSLISARQYGDTVRLVTDTGRPELKWWTPGENKVSVKIATAHNKKLVQESSVEDWMPSVKHAGRTQRLTDCADVFRPRVWSGSETIAVSTFKAGAPSRRSTVGITASGGIVYSSAQRLYVASTQWLHPHQSPGLFNGRGGPAGRIIAPGNVTTDVHAFKLTETGTTYLGSGHIEGSIRDRWSLDEHDGDLRVAWSTQKRRGVQNGITVLRERDHRLVGVGALDGLGVDENLQSVRWFDDLAVLVTFRQVDPLYTIDLSDPSSPRALGTLKIPGYSGYLHPIGADRLLGLGMSGRFDSRGQAAVFDIEDLKHPRQVSKVEYGPGSYLQVLDDPRSFIWLPGRSTGLTPVADWSQRRYTDRLRVDALHVGKDGALSTRTVAHLKEGWQPRILPLDDDRVAVVDGDRVQLIDLG
jgi:hypothetical protein